MAAKVGIREVAERAGVSIGTVSHVLNKPSRVSAATLELVLGVMDEMGFVRNDLARQLKMGTSTTLGMLVLNVANPFFADLAHACEIASEAVGHTVVLGSSDQSKDREQRYLDLFELQRVRGVLIAPLDGVTAGMRTLRKRGTPFVLFDIRGGDEYCSVAMDGRRGGELVAQHLVETGRRHIGFLGGPLRQVEDRWLGVQAVCAQLEGVRLTHIDTANQTIADGRAVGEMLERMPDHERPDAIFAANDLLALGVLQSLALSKTIRVPEDIAIAGYDDIDYAVSAMVPLTTVRQHVATIAENAVELLLDESDNPDHVHRGLLIAPELIVRESTRAR